MIVTVQMVNGYGELAFQFGLLDENQKTFVNMQTKSAVDSIKRKDFLAAFKVNINVLYPLSLTICIDFMCNS